MSRENITWFGFNLTQKQAVNLFILSIVGVIFSTFFLLMMVYSIVMTMSFYDPYYMDQSYYYSIFISMLAPLSLFGAIFLLSVYSLNRSRKIAKFYSPLVNQMIEPKPIPRYSDLQQNTSTQFCPNCGNVKKPNHRFCMNCGYQIG